MRMPFKSPESEGDSYWHLAGGEDLGSGLGVRCRARIGVRHGLNDDQDYVKLALWVS
jgi:hypothetical protein